MPVAPSVAFVVDALTLIGGAEKVLMAALTQFPDAPVYCLVYNPQAFAHTALAQHTIIPSYLNRFPWAHTHYRACLPLMPHAIQHFDLSRFERIVSLSYAVAHGVKTTPGQVHAAFMHTPMRYAWRNYELNGRQQPRHRLLPLLFEPFRRWDRAVSARVNHFAAVSRWIGQAVENAYSRQARVIYPPVELERFSPLRERSDFYVTVSRLVAHKRVDLIIEAFNRLKLPLVIVGSGPERPRLEKLAGANIRFVGYQTEEAVAGFLNTARGYICAAEEDFGISLVEAQAAGCPVIAYGKGGALETVREGQTGQFFNQQTSSSLAATIAQVELQIQNGRSPFLKPEQIAASVQRFGQSRFIAEFTQFVRNE